MEKTEEEMLAKFKKSCMDLARQDKANLEAETGAKIKDEVDKQIEKFKEKLENKQSMAINKLEKEYNSSLWEKENKSKQIIISFEKECKQKIFDDLEGKLKAFTKSEKYGEFLKRNIENAVNMLLEKDELTICVTIVDKENYIGLINEFSNSVETIDNSYLGGCIVKTKNEIIDNTMLTNLKEKINENENNF